MELYYVTIVHHIAYTCESYEKDYFMNSKQAQDDFIERFESTGDLSLSEIKNKGKAHFNKVGMLVKG